MSCFRVTNESLFTTGMPIQGCSQVTKDQLFCTCMNRSGIIQSSCSVDGYVVPSILDTARTVQSIITNGKYATYPLQDSYMVLILTKQIGKIKPDLTCKTIKS